MLLYPPYSLPFISILPRYGRVLQTLLSLNDDTSYRLTIIILPPPPPSSQMYIYPSTARPSYPPHLLTLVSTLAPISLSSTAFLFPPRAAAAVAVDVAMFAWDREIRVPPSHTLSISSFLSGLFVVTRVWVYV